MRRVSVRCAILRTALLALLAATLLAGTASAATLTITSFSINGSAAPIGGDGGFSGSIPGGAGSLDISGQLVTTDGALFRLINFQAFCTDEAGCDYGVTINFVITGSGYFNVEHAFGAALDWFSTTSVDGCLALAVGLDSTSLPGCGETPEANQAILSFSAEGPGSGNPTADLGTLTLTANSFILEGQLNLLSVGYCGDPCDGAFEIPADSLDVDITPLEDVPEPGTFVLLGGALTALGLTRIRRRTAQ